MQRIKYCIANRGALGGRNIERFVRQCGLFNSKISIVTKNGTVNAKSILSVLYMSSSKYEESEIEIEIEGEDEELAYNVLKNYLKTNIPPA